MTSLNTLFDYVPLSEEEEKRVLSSVGYTKSRLDDDLKLLRNWVAQQSHFPPSRLLENDDFFINFLIGSKGSIERCKKKLDGYFTWRRKSSIFADRNPVSKDILNSCESVIVALLPKCLPSGFRLNFMTFKSPDNFDLLGTCRHISLLLDLRIRCFGISAGDTIVVDCAGFGAAYLPSMTPSVIRDIIHFVQDSLAVRCDQYYFINCSSIAQTVFNKMLKPFMNKKMSERIMVTGEGNSLLLEKFPKDILPKEYGGDGPSLDSIQENIIQSLRKLAEEGEGGLISRLKEVTDESKRPKDSPFSVDQTLFGVQGTIKSLSID